MQQTGYKEIVPFSQRLSYDGGFCKWWFTPLSNITIWPAIDPATQYYNGEPILIYKNWLGPIKVPNSKLGFEESQQEDKGGIFYNQTVSGFYPGDSGTSRVNLENLPYEQFVIIGKLRAGGLYLLLGNEEHGLKFTHTYKSDLGGKGTAGSTISFSYQSLNKAAVLPVFEGVNVTPPPDGSLGSSGTGGQSNSNQAHIIPFDGVDHVDVNWSSSLALTFGSFPEIEVWIDDTLTGGQRALANVPIYVDKFPPDTSLFTIDLTGIASGIIVIK